MRGTGEAAASSITDISVASSGLVGWAKKCDMDWNRLTWTVMTNTLNSAGRICTARLSN